MRKNEPVTHIMTADPLTVHHGDPISKVRRLFAENSVHHLPVIDGENLVGIVSWTDLMRISFGDAFGQNETAVDATLDHTHKLEDIMNSEPVTIQHNGSIREAAELLGNADFHAIPVVDGKKLTGIVSSRDLIRFLRELY